MGRRSPIRNGLGAVFRAPSLWLAEMAWRRSFGIGAGLLIFLSLLQFLDTLAAPQDSGFFPGRNSRRAVFAALAGVFQGSGTTILKLAVLLVPALIILWIFAAGLGRTVTLKFLLSGSKVRLRSVLGLNLLRALAALVLILGCAMAAIVAGRASQAIPSPENTVASWRVFAGFGVLGGLLVCVWAVADWILTVAGVLAHSGRGVLAAIADAVRQIRRHTGQFLAANLGFALLRGVVFFVTSFLAVWAMALAAISGWSAVLLVWLLYRAVADFLYIARLAAYIDISGQWSAASGQQDKQS